MGVDIENWLDGLGLGGYAQAFAANDVDGRALPHLSDDDLRELGVSLGHRKIMLAAIAALDPDQISHDAAEDRDASSVPAGSGRALLSNAHNALPAERRLLTVFFCDLVGSTALVDRLELEDIRDMLHRYQDAVAGSVTRYGGHVAKFLGDGVLAYFGWPMAYEDHAERAVRAGLEAIAAVRSVPVDDGADPLQARVGLASGQVVVGDLVGSSGREEGAIAGSTPNLAYRLQEVAKPGQLLVAETTHQLLPDAFEVEDRGECDLKGLGAALTFAILGERHVDSRFEALRGGTLSPFIGRVHELGMLLERWELAEAGQGQAVFISGGPGIGKSRLAQMLAERVAGSSHELLRLQCSPYHQNSAFYPVIQRLSRVADFSPDDSRAERIAKLETLLAQNREDIAAVGQVYAELLSVDAGDRYRRRDLSPQELKELTIATLLDRLVLMSRRRPVLAIVEDAHWIDPSTRQLQERVIARIADLPVMVVMTHRPEWSADWALGYGHASSLNIGRLSRPQIEELVRAISGDLPPDELVQDIIERTDGVPLFVEELTRSLLERDPAGAPQLQEIPATLQGSLMERLDRLPQAARELAQIASVIGREFPADLLQQVADLKADEMDGVLRELTDARLVMMSGLARNTFLFRHALIQDAAYQSLLTSKRRAYHQRIADALVDRHPGIVGAQPELIARHLSEAALPQRALPFWTRAADRAMARSANYEAVEHCQRALDLVARSRDSKFKAQESLGVHLQLGRALERAGRMPDAMQHLRTATGLARERADMGAFVEAALVFDNARFLSNESSRDSVGLLEDALSLVGESDGHTRCHILSRLARAYLLLGDAEAGERYRRLAADLARRLDDRMSLFNLLVNTFLIPPSAHDQHDTGDWRARMAEIRRLADELDDDARARALSIDIYVSAELGDRQRMDTALETLTQLGEARQRMHAQWIARHGLALQALLDGDFAGAERHAEAALEIGRRTQGEFVEGIYGMQMFTIRREQGRLAEVAPVIKHLIDEDPDHPTWKPGFALIASDLGYTEQAQRILDELAAGDFVLEMDAKRSTTLAYLAEVCAAVGDRAKAERLYELLLPYRGKTITAGVTTVCYGAADRYLGQLAALLERWQVAEEHFEAALEIDRRMDAAPWLAHTRHRFATMLTRRGRSDDARRADRLLEESLEAAISLDMIALKQRIQGSLH